MTATDAILVINYIVFLGFMAALGMAASTFDWPERIWGWAIHHVWPLTKIGAARDERERIEREEFVNTYMLSLESFDRLRDAINRRRD